LTEDRDSPLESRHSLLGVDSTGRGDDDAVEVRLQQLAQGPARSAAGQRTGGRRVLRHRVGHSDDLHHAAASECSKPVPPYPADPHKAYSGQGKARAAAGDHVSTSALRNPSGRSRIIANALSS
jgi:hypothetical protein